MNKSFYSYGPTGYARYLDKVEVKPTNNGDIDVYCSQKNLTWGDPLQLRLSRRDAANLLGDLTKLLLAKVE